MAVLDGAAVRTGPDGRMALTRGAETIELDRSTEIVLREGSGRMTSIVQTSGVLTADVEKRNVQHFSVQTPFAAAVVKGTKFRVAVGRSSAQVVVERGTVQVQDTLNDLVVDIVRGQQAQVGNSQPLEVSGPGAVAVFTFEGLRVVNGTADVPADDRGAPVDQTWNNPTGNGGINGNGNNHVGGGHGNNTGYGHSGGGNDDTDDDNGNGGGNGNSGSGNGNGGGNGNSGPGNSNGGGNGNSGSGNGNGGGNGNSGSGNGNGGGNGNSGSGSGNGGGNGNSGSGSGNGGGNGNSGSGNGNGGGNGNSGSGNGGGNGNSGGSENSGGGNGNGGGNGGSNK
jgi:hypothetical protein